MSDLQELVSVRYMVNSVAESVAFYTKFLEFKVLNHFPAFADLSRGKLRLLLSGPTSSAGLPMHDGEKPGPGGWNRIHLIVDDIDSEVARLWNLGVRFRNEIIEGPGGKQVLLKDPSGNFVELFQPAARDAMNMNAKQHRAEAAASGVTSDGKPVLSRWWVIIGALIAIAILGEAVFAGAMLSGVPWAQAAHAMNAKVLIASTVIAALLAVIVRRRISRGGKFSLMLTVLAILIVLQSAMGALSAHGVNLLWIHIPLGVVLFALATLAVRLFFIRA